MFGQLVCKITGKNIYQEIEEQLAIPLGFQDWNIKNQHKSHNKRKSRFPAYHIYISTRDMAKIGQLMLNKGKWKGKQLVSKTWIEKITSTVTPTEIVNERYGKDENSPFQMSYGYMWWLVDNIKHSSAFEGAYTAWGYGGQFITVIPQKNIVVAHKVSEKFKKRGMGEYSYWSMLYDFLGK